MLAQLQHCKNQVPEFVIKLYHILQKSEYKQFISWSTDETQILIKHPKKLQDKVLPYFFRHKHLSSFIRQLNMYKFNKVNKITKERGWMYFKNQHFRRGQIESMKLIRRTQATPKKQRRTDIDNKDIESDLNTIKDNSLNQDMNMYRFETQKKFESIQNILERLLKKSPHLDRELSPALNVCYSVTGKQIVTNDYLLALPSMGTILLQNQLGLPDNNQCQKIRNKNMLGNTVRDFAPLNSMIFPSLCSLTQFDAL